ncbi:HugZ family pyridoxamine 5'-phosphate oxidase [Xanthobacter pseudotagetidis]|uniref:HugZ family pyridoxamine 5'-phosphate oxidase n=1 Tax=Xanthobacter pseudotagetidis TaxID=3119911 RepID=UPI003727E54F
MSDTAAAAVRRLIREARFGALGTLEENGAPYASLVAVATDDAGRPTFLISRLARHTKNIARDTRISLLVSAAGVADPMNSPRASLLGRIVPAGEDARPRFLARHADAAGYADFADFAFYRMEVDEAHLVEGFGRIIDVPGTKLLTDWSTASDLKAAAEGVISHMNSDHADAVALYATRLLGAPEGDWRMLAIDPEGCELAMGDRVRRLDFAEHCTSSAAVRKELVRLVGEARRDNATVI